jgi:putative membrane protein
MLAHADGAGWWPGVWIAWMVLFWGAVAFLVWRRRGWGRPPGSAGEAVLAERYARGEITDVEYRERLGVLKERAR